MRKRQRTVRTTIKCCGIGLHTGKEVNLSINPLPADSGIWFQRVDLPQKPLIKACYQNVTQTSLCTVLGVNGSRMSTVEHLMAAFAGLGIDNALVEVDAPEVPILDGSARGFVDLIVEGGIEVQNSTCETFKLARKFTISEGDKKISYYPNQDLIISFSIDFDHPLINRQEFTFRYSEDRFVEEISPARTFGFLKDVEAMKHQGYALGGSLENAIVIDEDGVLNPEGLRYPNEFVRHKILDFLGDIYLCGAQISGHFVVYKSGHELNNVLVKSLKEKEIEGYPSFLREELADNSNSQFARLTGSSI